MTEEVRGPYIQRCPHDRENPYAQISRDLIRDESLHPCTRWMLIYLLSMKEGWKISTKQIIEHCKKHHGCSRDKVYDWINQAIEAGYMMKDEWKERGLNRCRYLLSEIPKFKKSLPDPIVADPVSADPTESDHKKEHLESKDSIRKKEAAESAHAQYLFFNRVKIEEKAYEKLIQDFGQAKFLEMVERLEEYADINPKRFKQYANHATVIRKWIRDENSKQTNANTNQNNDKAYWAKAIKSKNPNSHEFEILPHAVRFMGRGNVGDIYIDYKDLSFYNRVSHEFKKRGWKIE